MATITRFEELEGWKKGRELVREIYAVSSVPPFAGDFALTNQIRRAAISIISNIAEGFERDGAQEFRQFLSIAKGSVGEVRAQLYVALDAGYLNQERFDALSQLGIETGKLISGLMRYLNSSDIKGIKYR